MLLRNPRIHTASDTKRHEMGNRSTMESNATMYADMALRAASTSRRKAILSALMSLNKLGGCLLGFISVNG
jgi:hypothetical protein